MKKYFFAGSITLFLIFIWWFIGGNIIGSYARVSPAEKTVAFIWKNLNAGVANIFEAFGNIFK